MVSKIIKIRKRKNKIKIMSYNIKSCQECDFNDLIEYFNIKKPDIICLQEVDKCSKYCTQNICEELLNKLNLHSKYLKTIDRRGSGEYGICIVSRYPIQNYEEYYYGNYNEKRGLQRMQIFVPFLKKKINVFNTHLDYKNCRDSQLKDCLNIIDKHKENDCILCGDLNLNPTENVYQEISINFKKINYGNTYSAKRPKQIIDYILLHKDCKLSYEYEVENIKLSDHKPLICNIRS